MNTDAPADVRRDVIESQIRDTRDRMDKTLDRLGERMQWRHIINDVLEYWRSRGGTMEDLEMPQKIRTAAQNAGRTVVDQIKQNPIPSLLIGAGVAYLVYDRARSRRLREDNGGYGYEPEGQDFGLEGGYPYPGSAQGETTGMMGETGAIGEPGSYPGESTESGRLRSALGSAGDTARQAAGRMRHGAERVAEKARETTQAVRSKASEVSHRVKDRLQEGYTATRQRFVHTADAHPITMGLSFLAIGLLAGLALPRTQREDRWMGQSADAMRERMKEKGQDLVDRGRHVVEAGMEAAKQEAQAQGLTPEAMKDRAGAVIGQATEAARRTAHEEGLVPGAEQGQPPTPMTSPQTPGQHA